MQADPVPSGSAGPCEPSTRYESELVERMSFLRKRCSIIEVSRRTGWEPETTRRYLRNGRPSVAFLAALCVEFGADPSWLLLGGERAAQPDVSSVGESNGRAPVDDYRRRLGGILERLERIERACVEMESEHRSPVRARALQPPELAPSTAR